MDPLQGRGDEGSLLRPTLDRLVPLGSSFYLRETSEVARDLLGRYIARQADNRSIILKIVETEAYLGYSDRASHAWKGRRTPRVESLYLEGGHAYIYLIYGLHHCLNAVTGEAGLGSAVLLRAAEPVDGESLMAQNRNRQGDLKPGEIAGGPGKLCQALAVDRGLDGVPLQDPPLFLSYGEPVASDEVIRGPRVGIDYAGDAVEWPLRFGIKGNAHLSRPFPKSG